MTQNFKNAEIINGQQERSGESLKAASEVTRCGSQDGRLSLGALIFPGLDLRSPWLLSGSPGWGQGRRPIIISLETREGPLSSQEEELGSLRGPPYPRHCVQLTSSNHMDRPLAKIAPDTELTNYESHSCHRHPKHCREQQSRPQNYTKKK